MADLRAERLEALKAKLKAREGNPGFTQNVAVLKAQVEMLASDATEWRDDVTGQFVDLEHLIANPETTVPVEAE